MAEKPTRKIVKKCKNGVLFSDGCVRIDNVRASYPHLAEPWSKEETGKKKFSITGLGSKDTHREVKDLVKAEIQKLIAERKLGKIGAAHLFMRDGDNEGKDECENQFVFKASENSNKRPTVRDRQGNKVDPEDVEELVYPGCYVNIMLRPWAQDNTHGKKINANLIAVQYVRKGERFGEGTIDDEDAFDSYDEEEEDFDSSDNYDDDDI